MNMNKKRTTKTPKAKVSEAAEVSREVAEEFDAVVNPKPKPPKEYSKDVKIFFDKKQYAMRIPRGMADEAKINPKKDTFVLTIIIPPGHTGRMPTLRGELKRG